MSNNASIPADLATASAPDPSGTRLVDQWAPPEKPSYRGEIVFLCVVLVLTVILAVAGVPGQPEPVAGNGSDRLRQGWLEEQILMQHAVNAAAVPEVVVRPSSPTEAELMQDLSGTWLVEALKREDGAAR